MMRRFIFGLTVLLLTAAFPLRAQFGGREGDVVLYLLTSKGEMTFQTVPAGTSNSSANLSRFEVVDPATKPDIPLGEGFPEEFTRQILHEESDDLFQLVTQREGLPGPHRQFLTTYKTFIIKGVVRETETGDDYVAASGTTLKQGADFGPDLALDTLQVLFWATTSTFPLVVPTPLGQTGPSVPPGMTGDEYIKSLGFVPLFIPWENMRRLDPEGKWPEGVDRKIMDQDDSVGSTIGEVRVRPGKTTPLFRIPASTHVFVLQGEVRLSVPGAGEFTMPQNHYAFLPPGLSFSLSNPKAYDGPLPGE